MRVPYGNLSYWKETYQTTFNHWQAVNAPYLYRRDVNTTDQRCAGADLTFQGSWYVWGSRIAHTHTRKRGLTRARAQVHTSE
jgi:hypothetical protein